MDSQGEAQEGEGQSRCQLVGKGELGDARRACPGPAPILPSKSVWLQLPVSICPTCGSKE